jgi:hypothetical protein
VRSGPPSHMHERMHDGFYMREGEISYTVGPDDEQIVAAPGAAVGPGRSRRRCHRGGRPRADLG